MKRSDRPTTSRSRAASACSDATSACSDAASANSGATSARFGTDLLGGVSWLANSSSPPVDSDSSLATRTPPPVNEVLQGDCVEGMARLTSECIDLVFADPPFNIGYEYDSYDDRRDDRDYLAWSRQWMAQVYRLLRPGGAFWLAIGDEYAAELKVLANRELGFLIRNWCIWYYTFGVHCQRKFSRSHTHLFYFAKAGGETTFNADAVRVPSARQTVYRDKRANPRGRIPDNTWILRPQEFDFCGEGTTGDCWYVPRVCGTFHERQGWHGCQMPEKILERIILACSDPGSIVLDPFAGSGTTLVVAQRMTRRFLGFELSTEYHARCRERIHAEGCGEGRK